MEKCILEHCEFAQGGQCCLVCPKGLYRVDPREEERRRIRRGIQMLERVKRRLPKDKPNGLPRGVSRHQQKYQVNIFVEGRQHNILCDTVEEAIEVREDGEVAKKNGTFDTWLVDLRKMKKLKRKKKAVAGNGRMESESN